METQTTVVIPHYPIEDADKRLEECVDSLNGVDELIVIVNEGIGYAKAVNKGLRLASGAYIAVVNNDLRLIGNLKDLCIPNTVTSPKVNGRNCGFNGCFYVIPRNVFEQIGLLDDRFEMGYYEDDDYLKRLKNADIPVKCIESVDVTHIGGYTMHKMEKRDDYMRDNKLKFREKWSGSQ